MANQEEKLGCPLLESENPAQDSSSGHIEQKQLQGDRLSVRFLPEFPEKKIGRATTATRMMLRQQFNEQDAFIEETLRSDIEVQSLLAYFKNQNINIEDLFSMFIFFNTSILKTAEIRSLYFFLVHKFLCHIVRYLKNEPQKERNIFVTLAEREAKRMLQDRKNIIEELESSSHQLKIMIGDYEAAESLYKQIC